MPLWRILESRRPIGYFKIQHQMIGVKKASPLFPPTHPVGACLDLTEARGVYGIFIISGTHRLCIKHRPWRPSSKLLEYVALGPHERKLELCGSCLPHPRRSASFASVPRKMMKMDATFGPMKKLVLVVLVVALSALPSALAAPGGWGYGHITFYGTPQGGGQASRGACGYQNTYALGYGAMTAALSSTLYRGGAACGACFQLKCVHIRETKTSKNWCWSYSRTITVTATNLCPPGSRDGWCNPPRRHFDLPYPAFLTLAKREGGVAPVNYRRVPCRKRGGIRFTVGGNPWFLMILIHNVGGAGDVKSVKISGSNSGWVPMYRNWGSLWTVRRQMKGQLSFMITTFGGRTVVARNAVGKWWRFGQTWECHSQFR